MNNSIQLAVNSIRHFIRTLDYDLDHSRTTRLDVIYFNEVKYRIYNKDLFLFTKLLNHKNFDDFYIDNQVAFVVLSQLVIDVLEKHIDGTVNIKRDVNILSDISRSFYLVLKTLIDESKYDFRELYDL